jgi:hypothetical protein
MTTDAPLGAQGGLSRRIHWLDRERVLLYPSLILLFLFAILIAAWTVWTLPRVMDPTGHPLGNDFVGFWSAARLAAEGRPEAAYDENAIRAVHQVAVPGMIEFYQPWLHPPTFLLVVFPLGLMPYLPALAVFMAASVALWAVLIRCMFADPRAWVVAAAFPAGLLNFGNGQNGFITAGLAGFALLAVDRRPVWAGVPIGLLAIKPHLAVLFPLALVARRRWRTFVAAAATAVCFTALSVAVFGWATLLAFLHSLTTVRSLLDNHHLQLFQIPSVCASALSFGLPLWGAIVLHSAVALGAAVCVWVSWRAEDASSEAKLATLSAASLLVSPYIFFYDLTWTGLALAWLAKLGLRQGFRRGQRELLAGTWIASGLFMNAYDVLGVQLGWILPFTLTAMGTWYALKPRTAIAGGSTGAAASSRG